MIMTRERLVLKRGRREREREPAHRECVWTETHTE